MDKYGIIYTIRNKINGKIYIGQTAQKGGFNRRYYVGAKDNGLECSVGYDRYAEEIV